MGKIIKLMFISILMIVATPAFSSTAVQVYTCEQDDIASDADVLAAAAEWLKAAKTVKGGENLELYVNFPLAAVMGEKDLLMVLVAPSVAEWGAFTDAYEGSSVSQVDKKYSDIVDCPDSSLWESIEIK